MNNSSSGLSFSVVVVIGCRLLKASRPGLTVDWIGCRAKVKGSGSGVTTGLLPLKLAVVVTLNLGGLAVLF